MAPDFPFADYHRPEAPFSGIAIVGEAPGASEIEQGQPFVGRSGQLLTKALLSAGIDRRHCLVANVFRYRPPENKIKHFFGPAAAAGDKGRAWGRYSLGYVREELAPELDALSDALKTAKVVLAVGAVPLWGLTGKTGLTAHAGEALYNRLADAPVIATYHPAFILRGNFNLTQEWEGHMRLAASLLKA